MDTIFCRGVINEMEKKNNRFSPLEKHKIMDLKSQGYGYKAIATRLELSCDAVKSFIRRHKDDPQYSTYLMGRCKECGKELLNPHNRPYKKFCCDACRNAWWSKHPECIDFAYHKKVCANCGCAFETSRKEQIYCTRKCYMEAHTKSTKEKLK